ncbi:transposase, MuDR, MULE transposase domain protein [Tanacetum coccineum]
MLPFRCVVLNFGGVTVLRVLKLLRDVGDDADFNSGAWVSATNYVNAFGDTVPGVIAHVYKVEAKETDHVDVYFGLMGRSLQITVTLKKEENAAGRDPTRGYMYMCDLPQNANAELLTTVIENGVLTVTLPKVALFSHYLLYVVYTF